MNQHIAYKSKRIVLKTSFLLIMVLLVVSLLPQLTFAELSSVEQQFAPTNSIETARSVEKMDNYSKRFAQKNIKSSVNITPCVDPDIPSNKTLSTSGYIPQPDSSTCGPTSAHNLLLNWGKNVSIDNLKTSLQYSNGQTPFTSAWVTTLNTYSNSSYYVLTWGPSTSTIWNAFVGDTIGGHPFILDTHMSSTNGYLIGYSGSSWWHYVTGNGYSGYYQTKNTSKYGAYFDPYNGRTGTYGQHSLQLPLWKPLVSERGIVW